MDVRKRWHLTRTERLYRRLGMLFDAIGLFSAELHFNYKVPVWKLFLDDYSTSSFAEEFFNAVIQGRGDAFIDANPKLLMTKEEIFRD